MKLPGPLYFVLFAFLILTGLFNANTPFRQSGVLRYQYAFDHETGQVKRDPLTGAAVRQSAIDIGAPDELQHANYIAHLKAGKGFPVLVPGAADLGENYQSHQPPLYYILSSAWSTVTGAEPVDPDSGFRIRFLNSIIGLGTLLGIYFAGIWGLQRKDIALAATAFAAFLPMNVALHAAISNDPLLYCLITWVFALSLKGLQQGWTFKLAIIAGVLAGLAMLTKTTGLICFPIIVAALLLRKPDAEYPKSGIAIWAGSVLSGILIALPWLLRNKALYGDFLAVSAFTEAFVGSPQAAGMIEGMGTYNYWINMVGWWTGRSFIGAFGYMDIFLFENLKSAQSASIYRAILLVTGGITLFGQIGFRAIKAESEEQALPDPKRFQILHLVLLALTTVLFIRFNLQYFQGQARYLFPAMVSFAYLFAFGSVRLMKSKPELAYLIPTIFFGLLNLAAYQAITTGFPVRQL